MTSIVLVELLVILFSATVTAGLAIVYRQVQRLQRLTITLQASLDAEHDLRTPMATILGLADSMKMMIDCGDLTNEQRHVILGAMKEQGNLFFERLNHQATDGARAHVNG